MFLEENIGLTFELTLIQTILMLMQRVKHSCENNNSGYNNNNTMNTADYTTVLTG